MSNETAAAITDIALCMGTFALALKIGPVRCQRTWSAFFFALAAAAGLGALYHGVERFHTPQFWGIVSCMSTASAFLFLAACACATRPQWLFLSWLWPLMGIAGILLGGVLAPLPFYYISIVALMCTLGAALLLQKAPSAAVRKWIYSGIGITIFGLVIQKISSGEGLFSGNSLFHLLQLAGNWMIWTGARKT
jgi:hypothetical protein